MGLRPLQIFWSFQCEDRLYKLESDIYIPQILHQNLTSTDVRFWRIKTVPVLPILTLEENVYIFLQLILMLFFILYWVIMEIGLQISIFLNIYMLHNVLYFWLLIIWYILKLTRKILYKQLDQAIDASNASKWGCTWVLEIMDSYQCSLFSFFYLAICFL